MQVPPLEQGESEHRSTVSVQFKPNHPEAHPQEYDATPSIHVPPF
jgi:hypothetical protein